MKSLGMGRMCERQVSTKRDFLNVVVCFEMILITFFHLLVLLNSNDPKSLISYVIFASSYKLISVCIVRFV